MRRVLIFVFVLSAASASSQKLRYRDVAPALDTVSESQQMSMLLEYLAEDQNHGNANFRLAMLHYGVFLKSDPLLEYRKAMAHAREASLRLLRAKLLATSQDVRSDNEYYASYFGTVDAKGKPYVEFTRVQQKMNDAADTVQRFLERMPPIFSAFTKSVAHYDKAVKAFAAINTRYSTLEDIYMFYDDEMDKEFEEIHQAYDSCVAYFERYKALTKDYPLERYNQTLTVRPITMYRMDGLMTRFSFLTPEVEVWNYSRWVDDVRDKIRKDIAGIKDRIEKNEISLRENAKLIESSEAVPPLHTLSKDLIFQLNNYDKNSLALALLEYKTHKQNLLLKLRNVQRDTAMDSKLELYSNLIQLNRSSDTLVYHVGSTVNQHNVKKHRAFVSKYYGGENGLQQFISSEKNWIETTFKEYQQILKTNLLAYNKISAEVPGKFVKIRNFNVPLFVDSVAVTALQNSGIMTTKVVRNPDGSLYVGGVHKFNKKTNFNLIAFVARINPDGKAAWMNELNFSPDSLTTDANNVISDMVSTKEGCALVISSEARDQQSSLNSFVFISDKGEVKSFRLREKQVCRKMLFQEANSSFTIMMKGDEEKQRYQVQENIFLTSVNVLGDVLWEKTIPLKGIVKDIVPVRDGYVLTGNFTMITNLKGEEVRTNENAGQSNPFLIKVSLQGEVVKVHPIISPKSIFIDKVVKVNDGSINLLGYETTFPQIDAGNAASGNVMHLMTNFELKSICSNF